MTLFCKLFICFFCLLLLLQSGLSDEEEDWNYEDDEEEEGEPRRLHAFKESVKNFVSSGLKFVVPRFQKQDSDATATTTTASADEQPPSKLLSALTALPSIPLQTVQALGSSLSSASTSAVNRLQSIGQSLSSAASNSINSLSSASSSAVNRISHNIGSATLKLRNLRTNWAKRSRQQQQQVLRSLARFTKRLKFNPKPLLSALHRMTLVRSSKRTGRKPRRRPTPTFVPVPVYFY